MNPSSSSNPALDLIAELEQSIDGLPANEQAEQIRRVAENNPDYRSEILEHFEFVFREMRLSAGVLGHIPVASQFREGDQLDSFRIKRFIDRGGMGEVYEAEDVALGRPVALKVIKPNSNSTTAEKRFQREGIVLAKLHHTHIVPIHRVGEVGGVRYCAMQYVRGATLQTVITQLSSQTLTTLGVNESSSIREMVEALLKSQSPQYGTDSTVSMHPAMSPTPTPKHRYGVFNPRSVYFESVARVVIQVADALQHSHQHGFCHRDIKPSNLIIDASGNCWVIDFGLAGIAAPDAGVSKFASAIAEPALTYGQLGTPEYMPPEQFGGKAGPPADIWSLGATMYELLTLQLPFACENRRRPDQLKRDARPIPPRRLVTSVPRDLQAICMKALATRPDDRYRSAQMMADDLRRWLGWQQTTVRPGWLTLRPVRLWAWRHKALAVAVFLAFFLLIGATAWSAQKAEQRRRELAYTKVHEEVNTLRNRGYGLLNWPEVVNKKLDMMQELLPDADLRDYRAATMVGLDARFVLRHDVPQDAGQHRGFSDVAFSRNGKRIATGGTRDAMQQPGEYTPGMLWAENRAYPPTEAKEIGSGPVVFAADDTPLQLLTPTAERKSVLVWNLAKNERLMEIPAAGMIQTIGVSPNAKAIAVSYQENGKAETVLWIIDPANPKSGTKEIPVATRSATAFAFSLDGKHVAVGTQGGEVAVLQHHRRKEGA